MKLAGNFGISLWEFLPAGGNHTCKKWGEKNWKKEFKLESPFIYTFITDKW
jgi:hypothetical protein